MTRPVLKQKVAFEAVLQDYHISNSGIELLKSINLVLLVAPTSVGKNTIIDKLLATEKYEAIVSDTTRPPRIERGKLEAHGVRYFFRSEDDVLADLQAGEFLEASLIHDQQVSGISLRELGKAARHHKVAINEVEVNGADNIVGVKPDAHAIFLLPPTFNEWMIRLKARGDMTDQELQNRMRSTKIEIETALDRDYYKFVVNDDLEEAIAGVRDIVEHSHYDEAKQLSGKQTAQELLAAVNDHLKH